MRKIDIQITKAEIKSFTVYLQDEKPRILVNIDLLNDQGKKITEYSIDSEDYREHLQFEVTPSLVMFSKGIADQLEVIAIEHCNGKLKQLESTTTEESKPTGPFSATDEIPF